ncbi:kinase-like domain-containing protein [Rhizophagus clarus]|uniref:Kinase-like domain-containing protein n=1 Tax=Rhizophagus clarus TaxID=94130 RepID=A0A8H3QQW7_9GLOM|nr:kinase-like domain-containing protein [Rhizophagus clarus]
MEMKPKNLWKHVYASGYQHHATIPTIYSTNEDEDESVVYIKDLKKRKEVYGICGECNKPGTGENWCRPCYGLKIDKLQQIARGLLDIHNAGFVHKDFHSGNIVHNTYDPFISDLGMCQPVSKQTTEIEGVYGVLPYMAPEVLRRHRYTKAADIYSFGIVMNEFLSEEIPFNDIPHDEFLAVKICKGHRPKISKVVPKLLTDLVIKCLDAEIKNRPTAKEVYQTLTKWNDEKYDKTSELHSQIKECDKIREKKFNRSSEDKSINTQSHPQAIYTSRLLQFKNLPKPVNSSVLFNSDINYTNQLTSANTLSECLDVQLSELELNEINENDIE